MTYDEVVKQIVYIFKVETKIAQDFLNLIGFQKMQDHSDYLENTLTHKMRLAEQMQERCEELERNQQNYVEGTAAEIREKVKERDAARALADRAKPLIDEYEDVAYQWGYKPSQEVLDWLATYEARDWKEK